MMKLIFLDIDGVLNGHNFCHEAQSNLINRDCVARLNRIILKTGAKVVLSSAWRYMILGGAQTLAGFEYMLRTHGATAAMNIIGHTVSDETEDCETRGKQISRYGDECSEDVEAYVVIDDDSYDIAGEGHPLVQTDGQVGLTDADADRAIELLAGTAVAR
jgi:hypothetical protein